MALEKILRLMFIFPIKKNRIIFESYSGRQMSCNPLYIYRYLKKLYPELELIWSIDSSSLSQQKEESCYVVRNTLKYLYALITANVYVTNGGYTTHIPFRKRQLIINTWHGGGAYKRNKEDDSCSSMILRKMREYSVRKEINDTTFFLSSSKVFSDLICEDVGYHPFQMLEIGMPRNDILFNIDKTINKAREVRQKLGINEDVFCVLYAPTYRKSYVNPSFNMRLDISLLKNAIKHRFSYEKVILLFRGHNSFCLLKSDIEFSDKTVIDVSRYPDMQELLCAINMLISDYSSCIWDFSFTYKPCFLFVPDIEEYNRDRGFYMPIDQWGFPVSVSNEDLVKAIEDYDPIVFREAMERHHEQLGSFERGNATRKVADIIVSHINNYK